MAFRVLSSMLALTIAASTLPACATARMHSEAELDAVGRQCGLALGELVQDEEEKRLLFFFKIAPTPAERACVLRWARRNHLRPVIIEAANDPEPS